VDQTASETASEMTREDEHLIYQIFLPFSEGREEWRNRLPHLTSSDMVNVQLYALLGVVLRQFVQSWHNAIVEDDTFVFTILETLSKTIREVEQRVSKVRSSTSNGLMRAILTASVILIALSLMICRILYIRILKVSYWKSGDCKGLSDVRLFFGQGEDGGWRV
jgi:hypothetical protein